MTAKFPLATAFGSLLLTLSLFASPSFAEDRAPFQKYVIVNLGAGENHTDWVQVLQNDSKHRLVIEHVWIRSFWNYGSTPPSTIPGSLTLAVETSTPELYLEEWKLKYEADPILSSLTLMPNVHHNTLMFVAPGKALKYQFIVQGYNGTKFLQFGISGYLEKVDE